ncbi:MAG TPA: lytic murein transglycosylase, partial [Allosphingosinicella sp.]|nr:lytic murein transglycosylase [Allosphingosinicella sp.]
MRFGWVLAAALVSGMPIGESSAQAQAGGLSQQGFEAYLPRLRAEAERSGIRQATLDRVFPTLVFSPRTVQLDRGQPGGIAGSSATPPFAPYRARHLTPALIARGRARYADNLGSLNQIGRRYGVPPAILIAIWGKETSYGTVMGNFDLLNSLASLAYDGRRRELFTGEFIATLRMVERGFRREELKGSWAGAAGHPQFLPSVYIRLAVDGDGDG